MSFAARVRRGVLAKAPPIPRSRMNQTEAAWAALLDLDPRISSWYYEGVKLRLADGAYYTPDFLVVTSDGLLELHEVKGFYRTAAKVRIKVAAERFPM